MSKEMADSTVRVVVNGHTCHCAPGTRLSELLAMYGYGHQPCGGHGRCGGCRVTVVGDVSPATSDERLLLSAAGAAENERLACRTEVRGDCTVTVRAATRESVCTEGVASTVAVGDALMPAFAAYGVAIDIGTTTIAAKLYDRAGRVRATVGCRNPQGAWGADVVARMEAALRGHANRIAALTRHTLNRICIELAEQAGIAPCEMDGLVITGNTVMLHLLTGTDVEPLTHAPFAAARLFGETIPASALGLSAVASHARVYLPPAVSAFIGADAVTALLAADMDVGNDTALLVDIGTNGEMLLRHAGCVYACSTAAGPAFEGVGLTSGMSGCAGAIDRVRLEPDTTADAGYRLVTHTIGERPPLGLCGSGLVDALACLRTLGLLDETGHMAHDSVTLVASAGDTAPSVLLSQADIRVLQLAKSAICAGILTLLYTVGVTAEDVERMEVAGGFGGQLDMAYAAAIGLIPTALSARTRVLGNAALTGAAMLLLYSNLRPRVEALARRVTVVELATSTVFADAYIANMGLCPARLPEKSS